MSKRTFRSRVFGIVKPSIFSDHYNPFEGSLDAIRATRYGRGAVVKYEDVLSEVEDKHGKKAAAAFQQQDLMYVKRLRSRYLKASIVLLIMLALTYKAFFMSSSMVLGALLFVPIMLYLLGAAFIFDRMVKTVEKGKYINFRDYLKGVLLGK